MFSLPLHQTCKVKFKHSLLKTTLHATFSVAALAEGTSTIYYPAHSEDSDAMRRCIRDLGAVIDEDDEKITITGFGLHPKDVQELDVGNAGAVLRFLMAIAALCPDVTFINRYPDSLGKRPHDDLIESLDKLVYKWSIIRADFQ